MGQKSLPEKCQLDPLKYCCISFYLGDLHHFSEPNVENDCGVKNAVLLKDVLMSVCILSLVCIIPLGVSTVEVRCLTTNALPSAEGDSCDGGQKTFGYG